MKDMIKTLKNAWVENPLEMLKISATIITLFASFYAVIWVGNAIGLQ
jgi:predicted solute-binding protein